MPVWPAKPKQETVVSVDRETLPVSLDNLKLQAGIPVADTTKDNILTEYILTATELVEGQTGKDIFFRERLDYYDFFPVEGIRITNNPVDSAPLVQYTIAGVLTTLSTDDYIVTHKTRSHISMDLYPNVIWPVTDPNTPDAVQISYDTGLEDPTTIDPVTRSAILQVATALEANRGDCGCDAVNCTLINSTKTLKPAGVYGGRM